MQRIIKFRSWDGSKIDYDPWGDEYYCEGTPINDLFARPYKGQVIMQFTGLKDKNEKEIYEGDIVKYQASLVPLTYEYYEVVYQACGFHFRELSKDVAEVSYLSPTKLEVVGNRYEKPELLSTPN